MNTQLNKTCIPGEWYTNGKIKLLCVRPDWFYYKDLGRWQINTFCSTGFTHLPNCTSWDDPPTYRPFKDAEEFFPYADHKITQKDWAPGEFVRITSVVSKGVFVVLDKPVYWSWIYLFEYTLCYETHEPVGVKQ